MFNIQKKLKLKRYVKILAFCVGFVMLALLGLHIWFINNARSILISIVQEKSDGKIKLELSKVKFNFLSNQLQIQQGDLLSTDTTVAPTSYRVKFNKLTLRVRSFWPLLLQKNLKLDSIYIQNPIIEVTQWRKDTTATNEDDLSITEEMGKVYRSMLTVLETFGIRRIVIDDASLKLVNKIKPGINPVWITKINLNVLREPEKGNLNTLAKEIVNLTSKNQSISLPNGRHLLAFKNFKLELFRKRIELDSCTVTAAATGNTKNSYKIFFKKLWLVGVDFAAMSSKNLIRADSVYCENPVFDFNLFSTGIREKKNNLDMKKLIREFTSDLDLAYVGVKNAGIHLTLSGNRPRAISNSNKDNFEVKGLKVNADSSSPVSVDKFDMLVRDYHLYNVDSSAIFGFDSIHFINSKILLSNFTVVTTPSKIRVKSIRDFRFPRFELSGLDWYELIFNQNVEAKEAMLLNPVLKYTKRSNGQANKTNFFSTLQNLDSLMTLERLNIVNGNMFLNFGKATTLDLLNVNLKVSSNELLAATSRVSLQKAVDFFSMSKGVLKRKDLTAQLLNVTYKPDNLIYADKLILNSATNNVNAVIKDVFINNMLLDDRTESIYADGIQWKGATVVLNTVAEKENRKSVEGSFALHNIDGNNTNLILNNGITTINSSVSVLKVDALTKINSGAAQATGLHFLTNTLSIENEKKNINASVELIDVDSMLLQDEARNILANGVRWRNAKINIDDLIKAPNDNKTSGKLEVRNIEGLQTLVNVNNTEGNLHTNVDVIKADLILKTGQESMVTKDLFVNGHDVVMNGQNIVASAEAYQIDQNAASFINNLQLSQNKAGDSLTILTPRINFKADVNSILSDNIHLQQLKVEAPEINVISYAKQVQPDSLVQKQKSLTIDTLTLTKPGINYKGIKKDSSTIFKIDGLANGNITGSAISFNKDGFELKTLKLNTQTALFTNANGTTFGATNGMVNINLSDVKLHNDSQQLVWQARVNNIDLENADNLFQKNNSDKFILKQLSAGNVFFSSANTANVSDLLSNNPTSFLRSSTGQFADSNNVYTWYNAGYNTQQKKLHVDSLNFHPLKSKDSVIAQAPYQTDYLAFTVKAIDATGFNIDSFNNNKAIIADSITLLEPALSVYRDKMPPLPPFALKLLPTEAVGRISTPIQINTVAIKNGEVTYTERHEKSRQEGKLIFTNMNGTFENISNSNSKVGDSLFIAMEAKLMDEAAIEINVSEAYFDTSKSFRLDVKLAPAALAFLNPVIVPLSNVKIVSGNVDTLSMRAIANNYFAVGNIKMPYKNLRIKIVKDGNPAKSGFKNSLLTFAANAFIIKNNNKGKPETIYVERILDKSFFNYLLKIALNGMSTSLGIGSSHKNYRAYQHELQKRNLSPYFYNNLLPSKP